MNELCWRSLDGSDSEKILHYRFQSSDPWKPYTQHPQRQADYQIALNYGSCSKGMSTAQYLLNRGWKYVKNIE